MFSNLSIKVFGFLVAILVLSGCDDYVLRRRMSRMVSHDVLLPDTLAKLYDGATTFVDYSESKTIKYIVYFDSTECESCRISHLMRYSELFRCEGIETIILFSPRKENRDHLASVLLRKRYPFPIFLDWENTFSDVNPFIPDDSRFRSFLVDSNGKVLFIGDPTSSNQLSSLFEQAVSNSIELNKTE